MSRPDFGTVDRQHETAGGRSARIAKQNPLLTLGLTGALGIVLFRVFAVKKRDQNQRLMNYVIHTRMYAQGLLVACFGVAVITNVYGSKWSNPPTEYKSKTVTSGPKNVEKK